MRRMLAGIRMVTIGLPFLVMGWFWMDMAWGMELGQTIETDREATQLTQFETPVQMIQVTSGDETEMALLNADQQVFSIQIRSTAESAPDPEAYLGEYAQFEAETVSVIPLRGRVVRYSHPDGRVAEWRVSGMSGRFSAQAFSYDLAPPEILEGDYTGDASVFPSRPEADRELDPQ